MGQVYYDENTNSYIVSHQQSVWDNPPTSGPHKDWKICTKIYQYMSYAWDSEKEKYVGVGLLVSAYQIFYADRSYENVLIECFSNLSVDCVFF